MIMNTKTIVARWGKIGALLLSTLLTFCTYTLKVKDGRTAYERKQFAAAIPFLEKEFARAKTRKEKGQLAYLLGDAYRRTGQDEASLPWFEAAYANNFGSEAMRAQAFALKKLERYAAARETFKNLGIEIGSPYEYRKEITACTIAEGWLGERPDNGWTIAPTSFNSPQNDFAPVLLPDGRIVFTSDRNMGAGKESYRWTGNKFMDIFITEPESASPQNFDSQWNTPGNEGTPCFNKQSSEAFFVRAVGAYKDDDAFCKIFVSEKNTAAMWTPPVPLPFQKEKINYLHPALSPDGNTLYFSCNDPEGWGGYDLWSVQRNPKTETGWDEPKLLPRSVNTPNNELFPSFDADTLYFSSDGHTGMGGLDIFRTHRSEKTAWAPPQNLKSPINSGADDFSFVSDFIRIKGAKPKVGDLINTGYFTSNRSSEGARGGDDIYRFEQRVPPPKPPKVDTTPAKPLAYKIILEGYILEKIFANPTDPNSKVLGRKPLSGASVQAEWGGKKQTFTVKDDGFFRMELAENTDYLFNASFADYLSNSAKFSTKGIAKDPANPVQTFELEIVLDKIFRNREIVLENIYYDYDKWDIRPDAEPTLNRLAEVLRQNADIRIQLGSHTDCRGNDAYNQTLSQRRAQSAVNYLISKGIDPVRLSAKGYGESQPAADCACSSCNEAEHQTNRRTTFKVE
jgi:outer membrane protein OmpA-like peptidoglycan-associated protein/tetratricopeptide (TPR) repeat protein